MPVKSIIKTLSEPRISTYKNISLCDTSDEQSLGLYIWNKQLSGLFYPVLQVLEISLRNAINNAYIENQEAEVELNYQEQDWETQKNNINLFWFKSSYTRANNKVAFNQLEKAKNDLTREMKGQTADNLIAKLTFGFWVHMTDKNHRSSQPPSPAPIIELWPNLNEKAFPNAVSLNGTPLSIKEISSNLFDVNKFRNRLAHHEPLWKGSDFFDLDDVINTVIRHYDQCLKIINWINPDNLKLLSVIENDKLMGIACSQHTLSNSKTLAINLPAVPKIIDWAKRHKIDTQRTGVVIKATAKLANIRCDKSNEIFYTNKSMQNRRKAWPLTTGTPVKFTPKPSKSVYPTATKVKQ